MKRIKGRSRIGRMLPVLVFLCVHFALASPPGFQKSLSKDRRERRYIPKLSDFRLSGDQIIPEIDSSNIPVFSGSISVIPRGFGVDRFTAPPITVVMQQKIGVKDARTGAVVFNGELSEGFRRMGKEKSVWEPGSLTTETKGNLFSVQTEIVAFSRYQGYLVRVLIKNRSRVTRQFDISSTQQPSISAPQEWNWNEAFKRDVATPVVMQTNSVVAQGNSDGLVAVAMTGASIRRFASLTDAQSFLDGGRKAPDAKGPATLISTSLTVAAGKEESASIIVVAGREGKEVVRLAEKLAANPATEIRQTSKDWQASLEKWFQKLPSVSSSSPQLLGFYRHAAVQLLYDRWRVGSTFVLNPWYPTSGLDSGAMNAYAWDVQYGALAFSLLDPHSFRKLLLALPAAPLTEHFSIEPLLGRGIGKYYAYNSYAYINSVDQYLSATGDRSLLYERIRGKTILEWMIELAEWGETTKDPDSNNLLDYGDDHNLLELKKTGNGPCYCNEVPSPNGERVYQYRTVADLMEQVNPQEYHDKISHFRTMANRVAEALNKTLWLEREGWYGTRQRDGSVIPVYSIQVFDLLRIPRLVSTERARRLVAHLNTDEFVAAWGIRSMSIKDHLFDYNDHDWAGAMSYAGDGPQLSMDLFTAGFISEGWLALEKILWWPDHMAIYPQGIANDSYTFRVPSAASFGGRVSAGRANIIAGVAGVETVLRGILGLSLGGDGSIGFSNNLPAMLKNLAVTLPGAGRLWTARLTASDLRISTNDGFRVKLFRSDGSLRIKLQPKSITLWVRSRSETPARIAINLMGIKHLLHLRESDQLVVRNNGIFITPELRGGLMILNTRTSPDKDEQIEILASSDAI